MTYTGDKPFSKGELTTIPPQFPWAGWKATENWAALVDESGFGLGIYEPGVYRFIGGFAGKPGAGGPKDGPTGYIAPLYTEIIDWNIDYDYRYTLVLGTIDEIRETIYRLAPEPTVPSWRFDKDRRHWTYTNATDAGWPIEGELKVNLDQGDPHMVSAPGFWEAEKAPKLYIEAALQSEQTQAQLFWSRADADGFVEERGVRFTLANDGEYHVVEVDLSECPEYKGIITGLRFDPVPGGKPGDTVRVRYIGFVRPQ